MKRRHLTKNSTTSTSTSLTFTTRYLIAPQSTVRITPRKHRPAVRFKYCLFATRVGWTWPRLWFSGGSLKSTHYKYAPRRPSCLARFICSVTVRLLSFKAPNFRRISFLRGTRMWKFQFFLLLFLLMGRCSYNSSTFSVKLFGIIRVSANLIALWFADVCVCVSWELRSVLVHSAFCYGLCGWPVKEIMIWGCLCAPFMDSAMCCSCGSCCLS